MDAIDMLLLMALAHGRGMQQMANMFEFSVSSVNGRLNRLLEFGGNYPLITHPMHGKWYVTDRGMDLLRRTQFAK